VSAYIYDPASEQERQRLAILESVQDPDTIRRLEALGVGQGWRCLEVGGGAGSITRWLCQRVGTSGRVVATDIDTRFLDALREANLEVRRHDITSDELEDGAFDLVHARFVLEHLPAREVALQRMVAALAPGGWLLVEDVDFQLPITADPAHTSVVPVSAGALVARALNAVTQMMRTVGIDPEYGRRLPGQLLACGLVEVDAEGRSHLLRGGSPEVRGIRLGAAQLADRIVRQGLLTREEIDQVLALYDDAGFAVMSPMNVAAWGRRP
jgi:SAM-dependent methyltransferase